MEFHLLQMLYSDVLTQGKGSYPFWKHYEKSDPLIKIIINANSWAEINLKRRENINYSYSFRRCVFLKYRSIKFG